MNEQISSETMTRYLYGRLDGPELDAFEDRLFADPDLAFEVDAAENDLVDLYVAGEMAAAESAEFEKHYLISARRADKVAAARAIKARLTPSTTAATVPSDGLSVWESIAAMLRPARVAMAGGLVALAVLLVAGYLLWDRAPEKQLVANKGPEIELPTPAPVNAVLTGTPELRPTPEQPPAATPSPQPADPRPAQPPAQKRPAVLAFTLVPPIRSGNRPVLEIPAGGGAVQFRLTDVVDDKYSNYRVELRDGSGGTVWTTVTGRIPARRQAMLTVSVPRPTLRPGSYELAVAGTTSDGSVEEINFFNFEVRSGPEE